VSVKGGIREQIRAAFVENLALKIFSLACAIALFAFTHGSEQAQRTFSVSVLSILPPNAAKRQLVSQLPAEVRVTLRGTRTRLDDLHADDLGPLQLELRDGKDRKVDIDEKLLLHIPVGVTIEQIAPASIEVKWDDVISKPVPVQVPRTGDPAPGYVVKGQVTTDPVEVQVHGPKSVVDGIKSARAVPFDVTGLGQGVHTLKLPLEKPPSLTGYDVDVVTAGVDITRQLVTKTFSRLKVEVIGLPRATTRPTTVSVVVTGTAEDVNAISPDAVIPRVEPKAAGDDLAKPGNDNLPVLVDVPKGVTAQVDPPKVVVTW
jgi:YbbR domain-containing protein